MRRYVKSCNNRRDGIVYSNPTPRSLAVILTSPTFFSNLIFFNASSPAPAYDPLVRLGLAISTTSPSSSSSLSLSLKSSQGTCTL